MKRCFATLMVFLMLVAAVGCGEATRGSDMPESDPVRQAERPSVGDNPADSAIESEAPVHEQAPQYTFTKPRIAVEDRYLYFESDALVVDGSLYCPAADLQSVGDLTRNILYQNKEYTPVRDYYESLGMKVVWDGGLGLVRVYKEEPVYGDKPSKKKVNVLLYHHILKDSENVKFRNNGSVISEEAFEAQMQYLSFNGYTSITLLQLHDFLYKNRELPDKSVLITFDDGYYSNFTRAYPILKKYNQSAVAFLITGKLRETTAGGFNPDILQYSSVSDLKAYGDVFEYATHTHWLHDYDEHGVTLFSKVDAYTMLSDLSVSFDIVNNNMAMAYPLGLYNNGIIKNLREESPIKLAFTTRSGSVTSTSDPYKLNRHVIWPSMNINAFAKLLK